jgi:UDP-N-acetylglucosamine 2-epimerase (non-hydrolysing)
MKRIMFIFGTRPEAIKMAPIIKKFQYFTSFFRPVVVVTAQHRHLLDQTLKIFHINPNYDLNIMQENQSLEEITIRSLKKLSEIIHIEKPKVIFVQGDTTTTFVGALAGFYNKVTVCHIEAGLRTNDKFQPFPEEINRRLTSVITDMHFTPTNSSAENLKKEGISASQIFITGNTVIDALLEIINRKYVFNNQLEKIINNKNRLILLTTHRRENFGNPMKNICLSIKKISELFENVEILFPVHPNPKVKSTAYELLSNNRKIHLLSPMDYEAFAHTMNKVHLILTDSGGIQEEAPSLGKPVLVLRHKTERPEAVKAGTVKMVGTDKEKIIEETSSLLKNNNEYNKMARAMNPYGDGKAAERIFNVIHSKIS